MGPTSPHVYNEQNCSQCMMLPPKLCVVLCPQLLHLSKPCLLAKTLGLSRQRPSIVGSLRQSFTPPLKKKNSLSSQPANIVQKDGAVKVETNYKFGSGVPQCGMVVSVIQMQGCETLFLVIVTSEHPCVHTAFFALYKPYSLLVQCKATLNLSRG